MKEKIKIEQAKEYEKQIKISLWIMLVFTILAFVGIGQIFYFPVFFGNLILIVYHLIKLSKG